MSPHAIPLTQRCINTRTFIERPALVTAALAGEARGLLVITAPAGYGKTWLAHRIAASWAQQARRSEPLPIRRWTLRSTTTLTQALRSFCTLFEHDCEPTLLNPDVAADVAFEALSRCAGHGILVVDMEGAPPNRAVQSLAIQLLAEFALQGRTLLACRNHQPLPLERIALSVPVQVFEARDLALDTDALIRLHGLDPETAARWITATEGWPVLCGPRLPVDEDPRPHGDAELSHLLGDRLCDYLEHELLSALPSRDVNLLMQASIFEAVEPGMLEAIGSGNSWSRFSNLLSAGLPLALATSTRDRIVLHPVFREFLETRLRTRSPALHHSLHRRAAIRYAAANHHRLALAHANKTGDPVFVDQLTESSGGWRISWRDGFRTLNDGVTTLCSAQFPKARLARAYWLAQTGRLDEAESLLTELQQADAANVLGPDLLAIEAVLKVYRDPPFDEHYVATLGERTPDTQSDALGPSTATVVAALLNNAGLYEKAIPVARAATLEAAAQGSRYVEFYGQWQSSIALHGLGQVAEAATEYDRTIALADDVMGEGSNETRVVSLDAAHAAYLCGDDLRAERLAGDLTELYRLHAWFESYARALEVALALSRKRGDSLLETHVLQSFGELSERRAMPRLAVMTLIGHSQQALADGDSDGAAAFCAAAQARIEADLPADAPGTVRVLAPVHLQAIRIALANGDLKQAAEQLSCTRSVFEQCSDGSVLLEHQFFESYLAVHARQFQTAGQRLSQCVRQARRHGLVRPFRTHAGFVGELVEYARSRGLPLDPVILQGALDLSADAHTEPSDLRPLKRTTSTGRLLLTEREMNILHLLSDGLSSKEMARRLQISEGTIKTHRKNLYEKLNVGLRSRAITRARELGLL